jgi:hypothetical protein
MHRPAASIIDFAASQLERVQGGKLESDDFYMAYAAACSSAGERGLMPDEAIGPTQRLCRECDIKIKSVGANKYLMGVRLKTANATRQPRLGPMTRTKG